MLCSIYWAFRTLLARLKYGTSRMSACSYSSSGFSTSPRRAATSDTSLKLWLSTLGLETELTVRRIEFLFILGNHVKHNLSRLTGVSRRIAEILAGHRDQVQVEQVALALDDFGEHLGEDYFAYYGSWLENW